MTTRQQEPKRRDACPSVTRVRLTQDALIIHAAGDLDARARSLVDASFRSARNAARPTVVVNVADVASCDEAAASEFAAGVQKCIRGGQLVQIKAGAQTPARLTALLDAALANPRQS